MPALRISGNSLYVNILEFSYRSTALRRMNYNLVLGFRVALETHEVLYHFLLAAVW